MWKIFIKYLEKFYLTWSDPLPVLSGNEKHLAHGNIVNTYLFYQVCKVHDIGYFGGQSANADKSWHLSFRHFCLKLVSWMVTVLLPNHCQIFAKIFSKLELRHQFYEEMSKAKVWWFLYIGRLVCKADNVMHLSHIVKQVYVDYVFMTKMLLITW